MDKPKPPSDEEVSRAPRRTIPQVVTCPNCSEETLVRRQGEMWRCDRCGYQEQR